MNFAKGSYRPDNNPQYNYSPTWDDHDKQDQEDRSNRKFENLFIRKYGGTPDEGKLNGDQTKI